MFLAFEFYVLSPEYSGFFWFWASGGHDYRLSPLLVEAGQVWFFRAPSVFVKRLQAPLVRLVLNVCI
ncbi:hypothetical protein AY555_03620 [Haematospirillum jordaniae]|uniref:Uncharacterized protein n=1 Tax=Haematospirillum jordaniae TaxID=1549855 RepID=A0A143DCI1_9PROT|nr:hypothetical protein AY555_03620 [Haematospirillum jordaniae]